MIILDKNKINIIKITLNNVCIKVFVSQNEVYIMANRNITYNEYIK